MRKKICNIFFSMAIVVCLCVGSSVTALAIDLPARAPAGYDKAGKYPAGRVQNVSYYSKETKGNRTMVVYTPPGYSTSKKYPVIYAIHGIDTKPQTIFDSWCVGAGTLADNLIGQGKIKPVIIVAMDNNNINSHNELFNNVMPYAESHYPIIKDADHRGIYGYSMGGGVTFAEGMGNLDVFHHVCPSSATPFNHPADNVMFNDKAKQKLKTLVLSCGTKDWCGFYNVNKASHDYCESIGLKNYWLSVPGGDHNGNDVWRPAMWYFLQLAFPANGASSNGQSVPETKPEQKPDSRPEQKPQQTTGNVKNGWYYIKNVHAQKYLTVTRNEGKAGQNVEIYEKCGLQGQKWYVNNIGNGYITLKNGLGEFMLDVTGNKNNDGTNIEIYDAHGGTAEQFMLKEAGNNTFIITTKSSKGTKALDDYNFATNNGSNVCQWTVGSNNNQKWIFEATN